MTNINQSLHTLGRCIAALAKDKTAMSKRDACTHVPYRFITLDVCLVVPHNVLAVSRDFLCPKGFKIDSAVARFARR